MLQFLHPIWLFGITGITLPVMIHLWNHRQGKVLAVGSIALLQETPRNSARRVQLSEKWLLLLRCLIIILLSVILAGPQWKQPASAAAKRGWVLVPRQLAGAFQHQVDSLVKAGFRGHYFEPGFPDMDGDTANGPQQDYWSTLALLQQAVTPEQPVYLFTDRQLRHFSGERPRVEMDLHWQTVAIPAPASPDTLADTSRQFTIWAGAHAEDAAFVQAALQAIRQFSGRQMEIKVVSTTGALPASKDWLFWLSEAPLPAVQAKHVLRYMPGKPQPEDSWLAGYTDLVVRRYVPSAAADARWQDGFGHALLTTDGTNYSAYTHFNSTWNGLPWSPRMPGLLLQLIYPGNYPDAQLPDHAAVQPLQVKGMARAAGTPALSLVRAGWLLLLLLFVAERLAAGWGQKAGGA
ncbi:hypothetical protein DCC81_21935 [Chitinophaga parva]|uniref:Aerotolerance regulator N-terminal domain-containing protein n=1 Tax=Chitinophaga parva TaxID=2169414 RepID=A0A2T7BDA7_9BACT|nr:BatA domain-containing protein [Chitinophaga parva]PUZ23067.1 hypothetical protein DCC81_21935 [Chitinophaga parva]